MKQLKICLYLYFIQNKNLILIKRGIPYFFSFRHHMMLICSLANFLNKCSLEHSRTIKNDIGRAANQHQF